MRLHSARSQTPKEASTGHAEFCDRGQSSSGRPYSPANRTRGFTKRCCWEQLLFGQGDRFVVSTKYTLSRDGTDPNAAGGHRKNLSASLETSLKRLRTDYIDIYRVYVGERHTPHRSKRPCEH
ncbi:aldo/keto reductase [Rhodococcus sp. 27YEA15]|uniref:aldo/keto reductase n=1 Tax=Rhodococcus sp. 27YEA15 TaxID=3156259 RepID=UPI003C7A374C